MKKLLVFLLIPFLNIKVVAQCNENQFEILCSTFSGEWAEEISWSIINNEGNTIFSFSGFETENNTEQPQRLFRFRLPNKTVSPNFILFALVMLTLPSCCP